MQSLQLVGVLFERGGGEVGDIVGARPLGIFGDSVTTDHISPAGAIKETSPAGQYLIANGVDPAMLTLEITESGLMSRADNATEVLDELCQGTF